MRTEPVLLSVLLFATVSACAAVDPRAGLPDVERLVRQRASLPVSWPENASAATQVQATVQDLLSRELTVDSAVRIALLNNRNLQALYQELGIAEAELARAGLLPNPVLDAEARFGLGSASGTGVELGLVQDLVAVFQIPLRRRIAGANLEVAKLEVADAVLGLALDTKTAFYRLQGATQAVELRQTVAMATALSAETAQRQREAGNTTDLDLATEQALREESKLELATAEAEVLEAREEVNALLGLWGEQTQWKLEAHLPPLPEEEIEARGLETRAVSQRLDLAAARTKQLAGSAELRLTRFYGLIPSGSVGAAAEREVEGGWSLGPALDVPIPIFDQSQARVAASAAALRANEERYAALAVDIRTQVRRARSKVETARQRGLYYERVVLPLRARIVGQTQREYNAMLIGVFQLLQAKREEIEAGQRYIEALTDYWVSHTELERAVGGELRLAGDVPEPIESPQAPREHEGPGENHQPHHHHGG